MNFHVFSRQNANKYAHTMHEYTSAMISIADTDKENINIVPSAENNVRSFLLLKFDDVDIGSHLPHEIPISDEQAAQIVNFVTANKDKVDCFVVNCEAGVSRSAGCCAAIMLALTGSDKEIFNNPTKCPNMTVYRKVLNAFVEAGYFDN